MAMKPNYRYERSKRDQAKAAKKEAKLAAKEVKGKVVEQENERERNTDNG
ncbi:MULTISPECIES: hypothetical protein [unclassified Mesorhizobium]|nr:MULTISPECIES: hypothetical protein [unclassified Mesorhizobium]